ncbi:MAG: hypothetical protein CL587_19795 [Alteromonadaceae bacterium]|nr:hypothetical protein [Alteromonadaceae bacterium]
MQEILKQQSEKYLARYPKIFFCHVPKCAGVSLSNAIYQSVYPSLLKATRFTGHIDLRASRECEKLLGVDMMTARETQLTFQLSSKHQVFTTGHCVARPEVVSNFYKDWHFLTILRKPADRFISEYVYNRFKESEWQKNETDIEEYLQSEKALNSAVTYARYFSGYRNAADIMANADDVIAKAVANLRHFSVYGTLEQMDKWQEDFNQRFSSRINIASKNTSPNRGASSAITSNPKLMGVITELNRVDQAIYDAVYAMVNDKQTLQARAS